MTRDSSSNVWTYAQRRFIYILQIFFSGGNIDREARRSIFNAHFGAELALHGFPNGLTVTTLEGQYRQRTRKDAPSHWREITEGPLQQSEIDNVVAAARRAGIVLGRLPPAGAVESNRYEDRPTTQLTPQSGGPVETRLAAGRGQKTSKGLKSTEPDLPKQSETSRGMALRPRKGGMQAPPGPPSGPSSGEFQRRQLEMIHTSEVTWQGPQAFWPVNNPGSEVVGTVAKNSPVYRFGGHVRRVVTHYDPRTRIPTFADFMLCCTNICATCNPSAPANVDMSQSLSLSVPFVHSNEVRIVNGHNTFVPSLQLDRRRDGQMVRTGLARDIFFHDGYRYTVRSCNLEFCRGGSGSGYCMQRQEPPAPVPPHAASRQASRRPGRVKSPGSSQDAEWEPE